MNLDLIVISPNGGVISQGDAASACEGEGRFDVIVLCAEEFQPPKGLIITGDKTQIIYAPNDDASLTEEQIIVARAAAENVASAYLKEKRVLVTCMQGRNRSGLVVALAMHLIYGMNGDMAADIVRRKRKGAPALTNPSFNEFLSKLAARKSA
jgi:hypothetical protein